MSFINPSWKNGRAYMNQSSLLKELKMQYKYFLTKPVYLWTLVLAAVLGYGYVLTHGTCGIDDISIDLYFENGIGVAIGRWPYYLINKIIPIAEYTPFVGDFVTVLLLMLSAVTCCVLFRMLLKAEVPIWAYVVFSVFFLDYSMNADVFVFYLQNGLGWVWLLSILSLIGFLHLYKKKPAPGAQILIRVSIIFMLTVAISFYESAANIFLTGGLLVIFLELYEEKKNSAFRGIHFVGGLFFMARYLVYAMLARRVIRALIMRIFSIPAYIFYRSATNIEWLTKGGIEGILEAIGTLLAQIYRDYFAMSVVYYPILLFVLCSIVFAGYVFYCTWKNKDGMLLLTGLGVYVSLFVLCVIEGGPMAYRACQAFVLFVAFVFFIVAIVIAKSQKWVQRLGIAVVTLCVLISVVDINKWFILDYDKTEYEMSVIDEIAQELMSGKYAIEEKPIVFVGEFHLPEELYERYSVKEGDFGWTTVKKAVEASKYKIEDDYAYAQNVTSILDWSVHAFAMSCGYNVPIRQLFEYRGYDEFKWADADVVKEVFDTYYPLDWEYYSYTDVEIYTETYSEMEQYPYEGYIEELEDCIVIKL